MKFTLPLAVFALLAGAHSAAAYCCFSSTGLCARAADEPHLVRRAGESGFDERACCCTAANINLCATRCVRAFLVNFFRGDADVTCSNQRAREGDQDEVMGQGMGLGYA